MSKLKHHRKTSLKLAIIRAVFTFFQKLIMTKVYVETSFKYEQL